MIVKKALTSVPINEIIASRWSCRAFDPLKPLTQTQIISICEAARWAPSCAGDEPWKFIIWNKFENEEAYKKAFETLAEYNQIWVKNVPVLICSLANENFHNGDVNRWSKFDTGAASLNIYLQAVTLGLMAHPMGGFNVENLKEAFSIPLEYTPMAMIAVGYQAEIDVLDDYNKKREKAVRTRRNLEENFYLGEWGIGLKS